LGWGPSGRRTVPFGEVRDATDRRSGPVRCPRREVSATVSLLAMRLALVGGGRMGEALAVGLLEHGWEAEELAVAEVDADRHHTLEARLPGVRVVRNPAWAAGDAEVLVLAVKPKDAVAALASCADVLPEGALVLSIAAGVTIASLQEAVPG